MTAAKVMDICIKASRMFTTSSRCSICVYSGQNGRCTNVVKNSEVRMSRYLDTSTKAQMAKIMVQYGRPSRSSRKGSVRSSFGTTIVRKAIWESSIETRLGKVLNWECPFVKRAKGLFLSVYVDDIKLAGKKENIEPTRKILLKDVDLAEPTSFLDHVYLGCTQRECQISKNFVDNYREMSESRISSGAKEKLPTRASGKPDAETISSWSYDMEGHAKKCVERYCELANKTTQQLFKVATPCMDDHQFTEEIESVGELSTVCSQIVLNFFVSGSYWETWYFVVCEQTCSRDRKMDKILWQTFGAFDLLHSSHMWI